MKCFSYTVNPFAENTYLLVSGSDAILIDPGFSSASEMQPFLLDLETNRAQLRAVVLTHAHIDHVIGIERVLSRFDVPVYLHPDDLPIWENYMPMAAMFGMQVQPFGFTPEALPSSGTFSVGSITLHTRFTPGHAPGHVSLYVPDEGILVSGDALFYESIGRTDLLMGDFATLERSIQEKLYTLPDATRVLPGHGPETTIGHEKRNNPFVKRET